MSKTFYKTIITLSSIFVIAGLVLPGSGYGVALKQPETMEEARETGEKVFKEIQVQAPGILKNIWEKEALPIWQKIWGYAESLWKAYIERQIDYWWFRIRDIIGLEVGKRKPAIEKEFEKEKKELQQELPGVTKDLLERFKELIK